VAANNEYNDPGRDSNKPASALPTVCFPLSPLSCGHTCQARISGGGRWSASLLTLQVSINRGGITEQLVAIVCVITIGSA